ncbi:MAG: pentapeptide repeat-containing protein [Flavobacteriaceae bacterium]|nr:pentapeptide repeat-containing protein [Flavobacteriaceae bacterium]
MGRSIEEVAEIKLKIGEISEDNFNCKISKDENGIDKLIFNINVSDYVDVLVLTSVINEVLVYKSGEGFFDNSNNTPFEINIKNSLHFKLNEKSIDIQNCVFDEDVIISLNNSTANIKMQNCVFSKEFKIKKNPDVIIIENKLDFTGTTFKQKLYLNNTTFKNKVIFRNAVFLSDIDFSHSVFTDTVSFKGVLFDKDANFNGVIFEQDTSFNSIDKSKTIFEGYTNFENTIFGLIKKEDFKSNDREYIPSVDFSEVEFKGYNTNFKYIKAHILLEFNESEFKNVSFDKSEFNGVANFWKVTFHQSSSFEDTQFNDDVSFEYSTFKSDQQFYQTKFKKVTLFSDVTFEGQIQFLRNFVDKNDTTIDFIDTIFEKGLDISRAKFYCDINFLGTKFKEGYLDDYYSLYYSDSPNLDKSEVFDENKPKIDSLKRIRESFRIIKSTFKESHNIVESLPIYKLEMAVLKKELSYRKKGNEKDKKGISESVIILWLNKWSNNHGTSWTRSVSFTILVSIVFYNLFAIIATWESDELDFSQVLMLEKLEYNIAFYIFMCASVLSLYLYNKTNNIRMYYKIWSHIISLPFICLVVIGVPFWNLLLENIRRWSEFITITNWSSFDDKQYVFSYLALIIGRIFIGYGIYQTINAFRKYGKN